MEKQAENKMGVMPVGKLIINMSLPMMISMLVQAMYNVVDSIFVAQISEHALTAVSLAFPIQNLLISLAAGTCVGVNALLSRSLGEKNFERADRTAGNAVFLALLSYVIVLIVGLCGVGPFYATQTNEAEIVEYGVQYATIVCCCSLGIFMQMTMERLLQATGKTFQTMITQCIGAVINIIMDPILIFGLFGFPRLEVAGAAVATVGGQIIASLLAFVLNLKENKELHFSWRNLKPDGEVIRGIYKVGVPSIIMQSISSVMVYGMNLILIGFTSTATAVLGVYFKLQSFIFMPVFGLNNGLIPIVAYNYGADNRQRVIQAIKYSAGYAVGIMLAGFAIFQLFPARLLALFNASDTMLQMGVPALRLISISFIFAGYCIVCGSVFQALGNGVYSLLTSVARQLVALLPAAYLLSLLGNVDYVWLSFPIAEIVSLVMSTVLLVRIYRQIISRLS